MGAHTWEYLNILIHLKFLPQKTAVISKLWHLLGEMWSPYPCSWQASAHTDAVAGFWEWRRSWGRCLVSCNCLWYNKVPSYHWIAWTSLCDRWGCCHLLLSTPPRAQGIPPSCTAPRCQRRVRLWLPSALYRRLWEKIAQVVIELFLAKCCGEKRFNVYISEGLRTVKSENLLGISFTSSNLFWHTTFRFV